MFKKIAVALVAASLLAAPAFAQDSSTFSGPRVEALIGYDKAKAGSSIDIDTGPRNKESSDGLLYGVGIGYDAAIGDRATLGVEGEFTDSTAKAKYNDENFGLGRVSTGRDLYVGARAGYAISPRTLLYVKGGYTNARFNVVGTDGTTETSRHLDADGWRVGAGVEQKLGPRTFAKVEYRYSNYNKGEVDFEDPNVPDSSRFDIDTDRHQVVASVGVRF